MSYGKSSFDARAEYLFVLGIARGADAISQVDIMRKTQLSAGTVASIVKELKQSHFLEEIGPGKSSVGRKPILLRFNPEVRYVVGAAVFADQTQLAVLDLAGNIKARADFATRIEAGPETVFADFANGAERLIGGLGVAKEKLLGVGVGFEGVIDPVAGSLILSVRSGWRNVAVRQGIEKAFGVKTLVDSEGAAMALGECQYGAGRQQDEIVCIDVDAGIGSVEVSQGRIRHGRHNLAGEIGHSLMVPDGLPCKCGRKGCLETVASGLAIVSAVRAGLERGLKSSVTAAVNSALTRLAVKAVFDAARDGDELALKAINEAGRYLGQAVAGVINYVDPELVILTGCVTYQSNGMLLEIVRRLVEQQVIGSQSRTIRIEQGTLGEDAALIGAATLVYEDAFKLPVSY